MDALRPECDIDDVALTHGRLAQVHELLGEAELAERHARLAQEHWQRHVVEKAQIITVLDSTFGASTSFG